jgi:hypothetical protein
MLPFINFIILHAKRKKQETKTTKQLLVSSLISSLARLYPERSFTGFWKDITWRV